MGSCPQPETIPEDVNMDAIVNIIDLTLVASNFGAVGKNVADINGDKVVNIIDLTLVDAAFGNTTATPLVLRNNLEIDTTRTELEKWIKEARKLNLNDPNVIRGFAILDQLLITLTPKKTTLLPNYPNPFNPETWIPYHLAKNADVTLQIYAINGTLMRTLSLGHKVAGIYQNRSRAVYWDGKNTLGEPVASGVYFYTLTAGDFSATRKMLILK